MSFSSGLKYKPIIDANIKQVLDNGALVHMFEVTMDKAENEFLKRMGKNRFTNFADAIAGKSSGEISTYRHHIAFSRDQGMFLALPTTSVKSGFPFSFYDNSCNVGVLIEPKKGASDFVYISGCDAYSSELGPSAIKISSINFENGLGEKLKKINLGRIPDPSPKEIILPVIRNQDDAKALRQYFRNELFEVYSKGSKPYEKKGTYIQSYPKRQENTSSLI